MSFAPENIVTIRLAATEIVSPWPILPSAGPDCPQTWIRKNPFRSAENRFKAGSVCIFGDGDGGGCRRNTQVAHTTAVPYPPFERARRRTLERPKHSSPHRGGLERGRAESAVTQACRMYRLRACQALGVLLLAACHAESKRPSSQSAVDAAQSADDAAAGADAGAVPRDTARATAKLEPTVAAESGADGRPIALSGTADLWEHEQSVTLRLDIRDCKPGAMYRARVHAGSDCSARTFAAEAWSAGEGIHTFGCTPSGSFIGYYARRADHEAPWTIARARSTDIVGHALTLSDVVTEEPVTCGVIERAPDAPFSETTDSEGPSAQIRGAIAGICVFDRQVPKVKEGCPDYAEATACASTYCELNRCIDSCSSYVYCLARARGVDVCMAAYTCEPSEACTHCMSEVMRCEVALCLDTLTCAEPPTPDGPCSKLQQCCSMNEADSASCIEITKNLASFGDRECQRLLDSWIQSGKPCPTD